MPLLLTLVLLVCGVTAVTAYMTCRCADPHHKFLLDLVVRLSSATGFVRHRADRSQASRAA